jgi:hypothetical protein
MIFVKKQERDVIFSKTETCSGETHFEFPKKVVAKRSEDKKTVRLIVVAVINATWKCLTATEFAFSLSFFAKYWGIYLAAAEGNARAPRMLLKTTIKFMNWNTPIFGLPASGLTTGKKRVRNIK